MQRLHVEIGGKSLFPFRPVEITFSIRRFSVAKLRSRKFSRRQEGVVIFQLQNTVVMVVAKIFKRRDRITVKMVSELKVGIELNHKPEWGRDVLVDLGYHQTRAEIT